MIIYQKIINFLIYNQKSWLNSKLMHASRLYLRNLSTNISQSPSTHVCKPKIELTLKLIISHHTLTESDAFAPC